MHYIWWKDFFDSDTLALAQDVARSNQHKFVDTTVSTGEPDYRKSTVLWHFEFMPFYERFSKQVKHHLPHIQRELGLSFDLHSIELQLTASGDNQYFKQHTDNGSTDTASRRLTFVHYFLLSEHRMFNGGTLRLVTPTQEINIDPAHNSIIFFPSHLWHEVMPVSVPSGAFAHQRFTYNGWCRACP